MNDYRDLKRAMAQVSKRVRKEGTFKGNPELSKANDKAIKLFSHPAPVYGRMDPEGFPINITYRSLWRTNRLLRRNGIDWPLFEWDKIVEWLYENWDKVLRVLLSLLALILI
jgi:hypothetical protein